MHGHRPEAGAVGRVFRRRVPVHRSRPTVLGEKLMGKPMSEIVQIGEICQFHKMAPEVYLAASGYRLTRSSTAPTTPSTCAPAAPVNACRSASAVSRATR